VSPELTPPAGLFGFAETPLEPLVEPFAEVTGASPAGDVTGSLEEALAGSSGWLLAPTRGPWVAFFGDDPRPPAWRMPDRIGCRTLLVYASATSVGFSLRGPGRAGPLNAIRTLIVHRDEPEPQAYGVPLPCEDQPGLELPWLDRCLRDLGIRAFDPGFYLPRGTHGIRLEG
jgi:hypothetical protein